MVVQSNLPAQTTPFVGRQDELRQISELLADGDCRLLTLIGPGGIGKTRLALEVAGEAAHDYADGAFFVPLQSLSAADSIIPAIAEAINFPFFFGNDPAEQLFHYLEAKSMLLVLDNFEHLLEGAVLVGDLLSRAANVKILATSRERLNLREEWVFEVGGLLFPEEAAAISQDGYSAVELFAQNARRVRPAFSLDQEGSAVARICALVGGMPLALELASSWVRAMSCAEIADEIQRGLDILETSARNVPERHRNMRSVLDHSWFMLTENERDILMRLSVFQDGFTRDAARDVTGASPRVLSALVDKSWLRWKAAEGRYDLHDLLRQYALDKLTDSGEAETVRHAHSRYFARFMRQREDGIKFGQQIESLADIERDFENVRAAWKWAARNRDSETVNHMAEALNLFGDMKARWAEAEELFHLAEDAFARPGTPTEELTLARMYARRVRMISLGMMETAEGLRPYAPRLQDGIRIAEACGDQAEVGFQLLVSGMLSENARSAISHFERAFMIFSELDDQFYAAEILAWTEVTPHNHKITRGFLFHALDLQRAIGDLNGMGWTLIHLSRTAFFERNYAAMDSYIQEASNLQRARGDKKGLYWSMIMAAQWGMVMGDFERGLALSEAAMQIANNLNLPTIRQGALATLGMMLVVTERDYELGAQMCAEAAQVTVPFGFSMGEAFVDACLGMLMAAYHAGDLKRARRHYNEFVDYLCETEDDQQYYFYLLAPVAALLLTGNGQYESAVELLSAVFHLPQVPGSPETGWLHKAPLIIRTMQELREHLGEAAYEAAWERGKTIDTQVFIDGPLDYFEEPDADLLPDAPSSPPATDEMLSPLTERELEVLALVAEGLSNREIAERLILALGTVKWYISEAYSKLGVTSRTQAVARARELGLIA